MWSNNTNQPKSANISLHGTSDERTCDFQCYCENTEQSFDVKNLCEEKNVCKCETEHFEQMKNPNNNVHTCSFVSV